MEELYITMSVYYSIGGAAAKTLTTPLVLAGCIGVIVPGFLSFKNFKLPIILVLFCPFSALTAALLVFGQTYEAVQFTRESEEMIARLLSTHQLYGKSMSKREMDVMMKRAKAFRPIKVPIGGFCYASMGVIQVCWEEILNQILFLLSF